MLKIPRIGMRFATVFLSALLVVLFACQLTGQDQSVLDEARIADILAGDPPKNVGEMRKFQEHVQQLVERVLPATVLLSNEGARTGSSGILIKRDDRIYVVGAAHTTRSAGRKMSIQKTDGVTVEGITLGADHANDLGLVQVNSKAQLPFVEIGNAKDLKRGQWVVMLGHPGGRKPGRTTPVRLGRVQGLAKSGCVVTDCTMQGGDSGGPLIDMSGRLVGINSFCTPNLAVNVHGPIDALVNQWDSLRAGKVIESTQANRSKVNSKGVLLAKSLSQGDTVRKLWGNVVKRVGESVVSVLVDDQERALGTAISPDLVVSKYSELVKEGDNGKARRTCRQGRRSWTYSIVGYDDAADLALLQLDGEPLVPIHWHNAIPQVGSLLGSPGEGEKPVGVGVLSADPYQHSQPHVKLGIWLANWFQGPPRLEKAFENRSAYLAGLREGDVIVQIGKERIKNGQQLMRLVSQRRVGDTIQLVAIRGEAQHTFDVKLDVERTRQRRGQEVVWGPLSDVRWGFETVLQHDTVLLPKHCGGPLVDLQGRVIGVNIARAGRVETLALPSADVQLIVAGLLKAAGKTSAAGAPGVDKEMAPDGSSDEHGNVADQPRIAYPVPFSRPSSAGKDYDTWSDALGPDVGEVTPDLKRLPKKVDNSLRPEYPPIYNQGNHGVCGQYASVTSIFGYEQNLLNGTVADSDATRFSPYFSWNMMNRAGNNGSEAYHGWEVAKRLGIPTAKSYGGIKFKRIGLWPDGYSIWREAMEYRLRGYRYSPVSTVEQLNEAKGWLFNRNQPGKPGGLLAMDGRMGKPPKRTFKIAKGEYQEGNLIWTRWNPSGFGHGMACVGYDDGVGYDVNGDGKITNNLDINGDGKLTLADWERGAFIVANSWGKNWSTEGKIYLLYSAMIDSDWKRGNYLGRVEVSRYRPRVTLRLKLSCNERSNLRTSIGIAGDETVEKAEQFIKPEVLNGWPLFKGSNPGAVPIAGPGENKPIEMGIDISELFDRYGQNGTDKARIFLNFRRARNSKAKGCIHFCAIRFYDDKGKLIRELPFDIPDGRFGENELVTFADISNNGAVGKSKDEDGADRAASNELELSKSQLPLFKFLRVQEAWKEAGDANGCRVGILDAGFDFFHPSLKDVLEPTFHADGVYHLASSKMISHGTAMASLIAAQRVNEDGMVGLAPKSKLLAASMGSIRPPKGRDGMRDWIDSKTRTAAEGLVALVDAGAKVINFSAHFDERTMAPFPEFQARLDKAYAYAAKHDVLVVVSAGNTGRVERVYPGTPKSVLVVGASLLSDKLWEQEWQQGSRKMRVGTCTGPRLSVVAPVQKLMVANPHEEASYKFKESPFGPESGKYPGLYTQIPRGATSQAAPIVSSLAALIRSVRPELSTEHVISIIQRSAVDLGKPGRDDRFGHGRVDFFAALQMARKYEVKKAEPGN